VLEPSAELIEVEGGDHFDVIDVAHPVWSTIADWLAARLAVTS
jgi:hypothetical protein